MVLNITPLLCYSHDECITDFIKRFVVGETQDLH